MSAPKMDHLSRRETMGIIVSHLLLAPYRMTFNASKSTVVAGSCSVVMSSSLMLYVLVSFR